MAAIIKALQAVPSWEGRVRVMRYIVQRYNLPFAYDAAHRAQALAVAK